MKKTILILPIIGAVFSGCGVQETMQNLECNKQAVQRSTCAIEQNIQAIEEANRKIDENRRQLEEINRVLKSTAGGN
ncbi:MAG: hypothetical protein KDK62_02140 [Chlamydiia bacterium]|nr:hypothetical protein [Chlamydiia bacterium]